jgi:hypothetical protein
MDSKFTWKAEIEFNGTPEQFNTLTEALGKLNITIVPPDRYPFPWPRPYPPGLLRRPIAEQVAAKYLGAPAFRAELVTRLKYLQDIRGGIRDPHLHLGEDVVFIDRLAFRAYIGEVAQALAQQQVDLGGDYIDVVAGLNPVATLPGPLP